VSKGTVKLREFECRQGGNKVSQFSLEHQGEEVAADRANTRQAVLRPQNNFGRESKNLTVHGRADHSGNIFVFGNKGSGYHDIETGFGSTLGNFLSCSVDLSSPHERACSEMSNRACRARRLRCFRKIAPSLISVARLRSRPTYSRSAARISAVRLRRRGGDFLASSSKSFDVSSSMAIFFMTPIISVPLDYAQGFDAGNRLAEGLTQCRRGFCRQQRSSSRRNSSW
jgi:hypothetical protein